jgi:NAD(P)-dependent dehydrogenase (short-subunit alcohol dehydrogenase family)
MNNLLPGSIENYKRSAEQIASLPMRRQGRVDEIGRVVTFLASADAGYIAGQNMRVDGGLARSL